MDILVEYIYILKSLIIGNLPLILHMLHQGFIKSYIKLKYNGRTMGYPDFQMKEFEADSYSYYDELGLSINIVRSEIFDFYRKKGFPIHMYCADTKEDVEMCVSKGASLITANNPVPLMEYLGKL